MKTHRLEPDQVVELLAATLAAREAPPAGRASFPLRAGVWVSIGGLPDDIGPADVDRLVTWLRGLAVPGSSIEVCPCGKGAADRGRACPACGELIGPAPRSPSPSAAERSPRDSDEMAQAIRAELHALVDDLGRVSGADRVLLTLETALRSYLRWSGSGNPLRGDLVEFVGARQGDPHDDYWIQWTNANRRSARRIAHRLGLDPAEVPPDVTPEEIDASLAKMKAREIEQAAEPAEQEAPNA